jgi:hypothetical protein
MGSLPLENKKLPSPVASHCLISPFAFAAGIASGEILRKEIAASLQVIGQIQ